MMNKIQTCKYYPKGFFFFKRQAWPHLNLTFLNINLNLSSSICLACVHCVGSQHQKRDLDKQFTGLSTVLLWVLPKVGTHSGVNLASFSTPCSSCHFAQASWCYMSNLFPNICKHLLQFRKLSFSPCLETILDTSNWANSFCTLRKSTPRHQKQL